MVSNFKDRLNEAFRFSGLTQKELADIAGISKALMNQYFKGTSAPTLKDIDRIIHMARILNVNPAWLAGYDVPRDFFRLDYDKTVNILKKLKLLNDEGLEKTKSYIDDLLESPKYQRSEEVENKKLA